MRAKIGDWGGSSAIRIPASVLKKLNMRKGNEVELSVEDGVLAIKPLRPTYTLEGLLKDAEAQTPPALMDDEPLGTEWP